MRQDRWHRFGLVKDVRCLQVKALVQRALQTAPVTPIPPADRQPLPSSSMAIPASVAAAAQRVMSHVFDACLQVHLFPWPILHHRIFLTWAGWNRHALPVLIRCMLTHFQACSQQTLDPFYDIVAARHATCRLQNMSAEWNTRHACGICRPSSLPERKRKSCACRNLGTQGQVCCVAACAS